MRKLTVFYLFDLFCKYLAVYRRKKDQTAGHFAAVFLFISAADLAWQRCSLRLPNNSVWLKGCRWSLAGRDQTFWLQFK